MALSAALNEVFAANRAVGRIEFAVKASGGVTRRSHVREEGPLRLRCPGPPSQELEAVIVNTAGGVAGGDRLALDLSVAPGAHLAVTTAAAEKIYRSLAADSVIEVKLKVAAGGSLAWLPQETILFDGARLARTIHVDLTDDARLIFAEAVIFGRIGMGEIMQHGCLHDRWRFIAQGASSMPKRCGWTATSQRNSSKAPSPMAGAPWQRWWRYRPMTRSLPQCVRFSFPARPQPRPGKA